MNDENRVKILKALADEVRLNIIRMLYKKNKEMNCNEISNLVDVGHSTISYHLRTLREAGLTYTRKEGQNRYISLRMDTFDEYLPCFLNSFI